MPESVTEPPVVFVPKLRAPDGTLHNMDDPYPGWQNAMHQRMVGVRERLLSHLQHDESDIDIQGVTNHLAGLGMALNPYRIVTNSNDREVREALAKHDAMLGHAQIGPSRVYNSAFFIGGLGLSVIDRPGDRSPHEIGLGLDHEAAHANGITEITIVVDEAGVIQSEHISKRGFKQRDSAGQWKGQLGEEAFAILTEGGYNQAAHLQHGREYGGEPHRVLGVGHIHPKYIHEGNLQHHNVLGAIALEVLGAHDPSLGPALLEARKSQQGIDAMVARLEAISENLGKRLLHSRSVGLGRIIPDDGTFILRHALRATRTSTGDVLDICDSGPMSQYFSSAAAREAAASQPVDPAPTRGRIEVVPAAGASDPDDVTKLLRKLAETMRTDDDMA
jgi:hypothetical protein